MTVFPLRKHLRICPMEGLMEGTSTDFPRLWQVESVSRSLLSLVLWMTL
jgi:hypothetical protein